jgi:hypothetical protein
MSTTHNDLRELLEFSIDGGVEPAIAAFPMFAPRQIRSLYGIGISERLRLLKEWGTEDTAMAHFLRRFHDPHDPAQAEKIRQQSSDPSNK